MLWIACAGFALLPGEPPRPIMVPLSRHALPLLESFARAAQDRQASAGGFDALNAWEGSRALAGAGPRLGNDVVVLGRWDRSAPGGDQPSRVRRRSPSARRLFYANRSARL